MLYCNNNNNKYHTFNINQNFLRETKTKEIVNVTLATILTVYKIRTNFTSVVVNYE